MTEPSEKEIALLVDETDPVGKRKPVKRYHPLGVEYEHGDPIRDVYKIREDGTQGE